MAAGQNCPNVLRSIPHITSKKSTHKKAESVSPSRSASAPEEQGQGTKFNNPASNPTNTTDKPSADNRLVIQTVRACFDKLSSENDFTGQIAREISSPENKEIHRHVESAYPIPKPVKDSIICSLVTNS